MALKKKGLSVSGRLLLSYVLFALLTLVLAGTALANIYNNRQVAAFTGSTLETRYDQTRQTLDLIHDAHALIALMVAQPTETNEEHLSQVDDLLKKFVAASGKLEEKLYPKEVKIIREMGQEYEDLYTRQIRTSLVDYAARVVAKKLFETQLGTRYVEINYNLCKISGSQAVPRSTVMPRRTRSFAPRAMFFISSRMAVPMSSSLRALSRKRSPAYVSFSGVVERSNSVTPRSFS